MTIEQVKNGTLGSNITEVVYVGHSFGSLSGQLLSAKYPNDCSRFLLTGWATLTTSINLFSDLGSTASAKTVQPSVYGNLPAGYLEDDIAYIGGMQTYYGSGTTFAGKYYDENIQALIWDHRGTTTLGELFTCIFLLTVASEFTGDVFVITGQYDAFFCGFYELADCGNGSTSVPAKSAKIYPNAASYEYYMPPNTGHEVQFHYTHTTTIEKAFAWLSATG